MEALTDAVTRVFTQVRDKEFYIAQVRGYLQDGFFSFILKTSDSMPCAGTENVHLEKCVVLLWTVFG